MQEKQILHVAIQSLHVERSIAANVMNVNKLLVDVVTNLDKPKSSEHFGKPLDSCWKSQTCMWNMPQHMARDMETHTSANAHGTAAVQSPSGQRSTRESQGLANAHQFDCGRPGLLHLSNSIKYKLSHGYKWVVCVALNRLPQNCSNIFSGKSVME